MLRFFLDAARIDSPKRHCCLVSYDKVFHAVAHSFCNWALTNSFASLPFTFDSVSCSITSVVGRECISPCSTVSNWMNAYPFPRRKKKDEVIWTISHTVLCSWASWFSQWNVYCSTMCKCVSVRIQFNSRIKWDPFTGHRILVNCEINILQIYEVGWRMIVVAMNLWSMERSDGRTSCR